MAMATGGELLVQQYLFTANAVTRPTTLFLSLAVGSAGAAGTANEVSTTGTGYARQSVTFSVTNNVATSSNALTFGPFTSNVGAVSDFSLFTASTGGTCIWTGTLSSTVTYATNDSATIAAGQIVFTLI